MKTTTKLTALLLTGSICLSGIAVSGCSKKASQKISEDDPWYSVKRFEVGEQYKNGIPMEYLDMEFAGFDGEKLYYHTSGQSEFNDISDLEDLIYISNLDVYDLDGTLVKSIDMNDCIDISNVVEDKEILEGTTAIDNAGVSVKDGKLYTTVTATADPGYQLVKYNLVYDIESGSIESLTSVDVQNDQRNVYSSGDTSRYSFDGYMVECTSGYDLGNPINIKVTAPDGTETEYNTEKDIPSLKAIYAASVIYTGNDRALICFAKSFGYDFDYYSLDLKTGKFSFYTDDTSWFGNYFLYLNPSYMDGTGYITTDGDTIKKFDFDKKEITDAFSFEDCSIDRGELSGAGVLSYTEDRIVLQNMLTSSENYGEYDETNVVYVLTKEDKNPNAGKTVITAASYSGFDSSLCNAICKYNETNPDYFIKLINNYSSNGLYYQGVFNGVSSAYDTRSLNAYAGISNQILIDIMAGEGPDILFDAGSLSQLNNDDYLLDLSKEIDPSGLFGNIIEASKTDGKLYQIPLSFGIKGIFTRESDAGDAVGFTYDQYKAFVTNVCNGNDPVDNDQTDFFITCLESMYDDCVSGKDVNFSSDGIKGLADYAKENVFEPVEDPEEHVTYIGDGLKYTGGVYYINVSFSSFIDEFKCDGAGEVTAMGLPSFDGRGPEIAINESVAISSKTSEKKACIDFVKTLLSEEYQTEYGKTAFASPVNTAAFDSVAEIKVNSLNKWIDKARKDVERGFISPNDVPEKPIDMSVIGHYKDLIARCTRTGSLDPSVAIIIKEEMPAYFAGQKSFEDVTGIVENRVKTFLNERG